MSIHAQRVKVKSLPRARGTRMPVTAAHFSKGVQGSIKDESGIFSNFELTYVLSRHVIGNIGEVTTVENDRVLGVIKAISAAGDMGLGYPYKLCSGKNGHINCSSHTVPLSSWKIVRIPNVKISDCLLVESKTESDAAHDVDLSGLNEDKELVPFFASSDAPEDCFLDEGGFSVEEMFKTNRERFSVSTTYNPDLPEYKTPVDKSAPNYSETEARCAQLAREIEATDVYRDADDLSDEDDIHVGSTARSSKEPSHRHLPRDIRGHSDLSVNSNAAQITKQLAHVSLNSTERDLAAVSHKQPPTCLATFAFNGIPPHDVTSESNSALSRAASEALSESVPTTHAHSESKDTSSVVSAASTDVKVKKSNLDPNAPLFQPLSMQPQSVTTSIQVSTNIQTPLPSFTFTQHVTQPCGNSAPTGQLPVQNLTAFVAAPQTQIFVPSTMPYGPQSSGVQHIPAALAGSVANSIGQQMRGGSLPPSLHQQAFQGAINSTPGLLLQPNPHPGASVPQMIPQSSLTQSVSNTNRFPNASATRQGSNELTSSISQNSYVQPTNMSIPTMQPPFYQIPQSGGGIPLWVTGSPQLGFNFVPGAGNSSALMVSNIHLQQSPGQQLYPAHAMVHVQPQLVPAMSLESAPPSAPQSQHHSIFQAHPGHFPEHPIQLPQYAHGVMFTQPAGGFYPAAPIFTGPGVINPAVRASLLPVLNQSTAQHPGVNGATHQSVALDSLSINQSIPVSYPQSNCPPQHLQNYNAVHPFIQSQHFAANASMNSQAMQPDAYQHIVALLTRNLSSQAH